MTDENQILATLARARDLQLTISDQEASLSENKAALNSLIHNRLPELFNEAGVDSLGLVAEANLPAYTAKLSPYYKAVIATGWDEEKREEALKELESHGAGNLAKRVVSVSFPRDMEDECKALCNLLEEHGYAFKMTYDIPWQTLTSWLKESVEEHGVIPNLDKIGGQVGQVVKIKPVRE